VTWNWFLDLIKQTKQLGDFVVEIREQCRCRLICSVRKRIATTGAMRQPIPSLSKKYRWPNRPPSPTLARARPGPGARPYGARRPIVSCHLGSPCPTRSTGTTLRHLSRRVVLTGTTTRHGPRSSPRTASPPPLICRGKIGVAAGLGEWVEKTGGSGTKQG
jgi:hypothetical protein